MRSMSTPPAPARGSAAAAAARRAVRVRLPAGGTTGATPGGVRLYRPPLPALVARAAMPNASIRARMSSIGSTIAPIRPRPMPLYGSNGACAGCGRGREGGVRHAAPAKQHDSSACDALNEGGGCRTIGFTPVPWPPSASGGPTPSPALRRMSCIMWWNSTAGSFACIASYTPPPLARLLPAAAGAGAGAGAGAAAAVRAPLANSDRRFSACCKR